MKRRGRADQIAPAEPDLFAGEHLFERGVEGRNRLVERREFCLPAFDTQKRGVECRHDTAQARIGREPAQERLRFDQPRRGVLHLGGRQQQQTFMGEERPAIRTAHMGKKRGLFLQRIGEFGRGRFGTLGGGAIDDNQDQIVLLRERLVVVSFVLAPGGIGRHQVFAVGVHREMCNGVSARARAEQDREQRHKPCMLAATADNG